jgi:hypothetical protein
MEEPSPSSDNAIIRRRVDSPGWRHWREPEGRASRPRKIFLPLRRNAMFRRRRGMIVERVEARLAADEIGQSPS